jgi:hypothetical protein
MAQNTYKFIEPNISFLFDSTKLKISNRYSNTVYETESYDFKFLLDTTNKVNINVSAQHPVDKPLSMSEVEKKMTDRINEILKIGNDRVSIIDYDKNVRHVGDFLCFGFILLDKKTNNTGAAITCNHISNSDITEIRLTSQNRKSLLEDYKILESLLPNFKSYSKKEIFSQDSLIKAKYSINISATKETIDNLKWRTNSYFGIVKTNEKLEHRVKEVRLDNSYGQEIFPANEDGQVYIACTSKEKGQVEKKGEFVIINSFGKNVKIPFTFKYENK